MLISYSELMFDYVYFFSISERISPSSVNLSGPKYIRKKQGNWFTLQF